MVAANAAAQRLVAGGLGDDLAQQPIAGPAVQFERGGLSSVVPGFQPPHGQPAAFVLGEPQHRPGDAAAAGRRSTYMWRSSMPSGDAGSRPNMPTTVPSLTATQKLPPRSP